MSYEETTESIDGNMEYVGHVAKRLTPEEIEKMQAQNSRLVSEFRANQLEKDAKKHWDLFYKRNDTRFFKDRHWTTREFNELLGLGSKEDRNVLLEVGCGVGNFVYPLVEDGLKFRKIFACDLSPRAVELMKVYYICISYIFYIFICNTNFYEILRRTIPYTTQKK